MSFTEHLKGLAELEDNAGKMVAFKTSAETIERLERERNELAARVERLRGALYYLNKNTRMTNDKGVALSKIEAEEVLSETPAKSLEAVKREWKAELLGKAEELASDNLSGWMAIAIDDLERL